MYWTNYFDFIHIEHVTLSASDMGVDTIDEVGDKASKEQAAGVYGADFTLDSPVRVGARGETMGLGIKISFDKQLSQI